MITKVNRCKDRMRVTGLSFIHYSLFLGLALTLGLSACSKDDTEDPAIHVSQAMSNCVNVLKSAPNGWVMAYYGNTDYGGYNVLCKFADNGQVTLANEFFGADTTAVTHYKMEQSGGIVLSFDEYCELFHFFSDPINPNGYGAGTPNGFGGDLEFRVISASADSVVLSGKKHGSRVVMTPMAEQTSWKDYLEKVKDVAKVIQQGYYQMVSGTDSLKMKGDRRNRVLTYTTMEEDSTYITHTAPYFITPQGITFYKPLDFSGQSVRGFLYQPDATTYQQVGDGSVTLTKFIAPINEQLIDGQWFIKKENLGTLGTQRWNVFVSRLLSNFNLQIYYAVFGTFDSRFGLSVGCIDASDPTGVYLAECYYDYKLIGDDQIQLWFNGETDYYGNAEYFIENAGMNYALQPFGIENTPRTFKVETDDIISPSYLRLVDQNQANNVITLVLEEITFPFGE